MPGRIAVFPSAVQKTERLHPTFCASATHTPFPLVHPTLSWSQPKGYGADIFSCRNNNLQETKIIDKIGALQSSIRSIRGDPQLGNIQKIPGVRNPLSNSLNTIIPVLGNEFTNPFVIIAVENHILCASHNKAVDFKNFHIPLN